MPPTPPAKKFLIGDTLLDSPIFFSYLITLCLFKIFESNNVLEEVNKKQFTKLYAVEA